MIEVITSTLESWNLAPELVIFIVSMLPILELRGGLIVSAILGIPWYIAFPICLIGNMLPIPFVLLFIRKIFSWLERFDWCAKLIHRFEQRVLKKGSKIQTRWIIGLYLFVAIPLPGTGGWTGALAADLFDIRFKHAFPTIFLGVFSAGIIMLVLSYFIPGLFGF